MARTEHEREQARQVREAYRQERTRRQGEARADLADLQLGPGWLVDASDGTLNADKVKDENEKMPVIVPEWDARPEDPTDYDTLILQWAPGPTPAESDYRTVGAEEVYPDTSLPVSIDVPHAFLGPDGPYVLRYRVMSPNGEFRNSDVFPVIVDTLPPWRHLEPDAMGLPFSELTDTEMAAHPGGVEGVLPPYTDYQAGDKVAFYWLTHPLPSDPQDLPIPAGFVGVGSDRKVVYPLARLEASLDQDYYALYVLLDKAGNRSPISAYTRVDVALGTLPDGLQDPVVPLAADGLLDLEDARLGIVVQIPAFNNHKRTDRIEVTWGTRVLDSVEVGNNPRFPISIPVPAAVLRSEYDTDAGGQQATPVSYRVLRGLKPSAVMGISVQVDFSTIGVDPDWPDWPNPVHPALDKARVYGKVSNTENVLTRADGGQEADLKFNLYEPVQAGEEIDFYWAGTQVVEAHYVVTGSDQQGQEITVQIPWSYIDEAGNDPQLPVTYRARPAGSDNYLSPEDTLVNANAVTLQAPGVTFEGLSATGYINCQSLYIDPANPLPQEPAARVVVPDLSAFHLKDGDALTLTWRAYQGSSGDVEYTAAMKTETLTLGTDHPVTGFVWFVSPYDTHLLPTYDYPPYRAGRGWVQYEFDDISGERLYSEPVFVKVGVYDATGSCEIPPVLP